MKRRGDAVVKKAGSKKERLLPERLTRPNPLSELAAWDSSSGHLYVVVDTPKGSGIKFKFDLEKACYTIAHILPPGTVFPFDFGSIPSTSAADGDPLDVLILMEEPSFAGCLVPVRLIGVLEANQTQEEKTNRNDRLIGVAAKSRAYRELQALEDVPKHLLKEIEHFFVSYNEERGRVFKVLGRFGPARAARLVRAGERRFQNRNTS
jgi:inorganic pyrophosphatase